MRRRVLYVERKPSEFVSIEKAFREIAGALSDDFEVGFQQVTYGNHFSDALRNLLFFRKMKADVYHLTGHIHYIALLFARADTVLSIMDVRFLYNATGLRYWLLKKLYLDWPIRKLDFVTAISEQTKTEILQYSGCEPGKIRVLDLPLTIVRETEQSKEFEVEMPTILQIGTMQNKNVVNLAKALRGLRVKLRIIGRLDADQTASLEENEITYDNAFDLTDAEMREEYRKTDIVVFCSTYEGFGLPIIEAQSMQKPVVTSNLSPMTETSGGAAALVDPFDTESIRAGIQMVISDAEYRESLIQAGLQNIERFGPKTVAARYENLYGEILAANSRSSSSKPNP